LSATSHGARAWACACAAAAAAAALVALLPPGLQEQLDWRASLAQPWRAWTAALVHLSIWHLAANLAGCAVLAAFARAAQIGARWLWAWAAAWPLTQAGLLVIPELQRYAGLSGVLHAGVVVAAVALIAQARGRPRWIGALVLIGVAFKVLLEAPWQGALRQLPGWDFAVAPAAHASGALAGLACAAVAWATGSARAGTDTGGR
jgi:rhomboid family GlyGly-CTERM serine protease